MYGTIFDQVEFDTKDDNICNYCGCLICGCNPDYDDFDNMLADKALKL